MPFLDDWVAGDTLVLLAAIAPRNVLDLAPKHAAPRASGWTQITSAWFSYWQPATTRGSRHGDNDGVFTGTRMTQSHNVPVASVR